MVFNKLRTKKYKNRFPLGYDEVYVLRSVLKGELQNGKRPLHLELRGKFGNMHVYIEEYSHSSSWASSTENFA